MDKYDACEQAYKNGYEQGKKDVECKIIHCKDCTSKEFLDCHAFCKGTNKIVRPDDFCSQGKEDK